MRQPCGAIEEVAAQSHQHAGSGSEDPREESAEGVLVSFGELEHRLRLVDDDDIGCTALFEPRPQIGCSIPAGRDDRDAVPVRNAREDAGQHERGLARAGSADDHDESARTHAVPDRVDVGIPAEEVLGVLGSESLEAEVRASGAHGMPRFRSRESGILLQHRRFEGVKPLADVDAQLVRQLRPCGADRRERLRLTAGAVVGHGEDPPAALPKRSLAHEPLGVRDHGAMLAFGEAGFQELLLGALPDFSEALRFDGPRLPGDDVRVRCPAPERECPLVHIDRTIVLAAQTVLPRARDEAFELERVDRRRIDAQRVLRASSHDGVAAEACADPRHCRLHLLLPRARWVIAPAGCGQLGGSEGAPCADDERGEDDALPRAQSVPVSRLQRTQHPDRHDSSVRVPSAPRQ